MHVALTPESKNVKTGPIPTSTSSKVSCPDTCPFKEKGCYAKGGPQNIHWMKVSEGERGVPFSQFCEQIATLPEGQLWRHNVAGDLPHTLGDVNEAEVDQLADANVGRKGYTYTHHVLNTHNVKVIRKANAKGFTINASTEDVEVADRVMSEHNIPAVAVVKSDKLDRFYTTSSGRKVITCPASLFPGKVSCATCGLCAKADRDFIVAFPAHGNSKKTVNTLVA